MAKGTVKVVGLSFRPITVELKPNYTVWLKPEPDNKYDPNAVAVHDTNDNLIGYVGKDDPYRPIVLASDTPLEAKVKIANYYEEGDNKLWAKVAVGDLIQLWLEVESEIYEERDNPGTITTSFLLETAFVGGDIFYDEPTHTYMNAKGEIYLSGSKYAESFKKPFNAEMIAGIMAKKVDGVTSQQIIDMWKLKAKASADFGSAIHETIELYERFRVPSELLDKEYHIHSHPVLKNAAEGFISSHNDETTENEVLVVSHSRKWAGRIDRLLITGNKKCRVQDFKTNIDIAKNLENYWLQLNFYGTILTDAGWTVDGLDIFHYNGEWTDYKAPFEVIHG